MFRRRSSADHRPDPTAAAARPTRGSGSAAAAVSVPRTSLAADLADAGWLLPRGARPGASAAWTLVGTVGSETATPVDPAGLVSGAGWSLDWWIGADDRWHLPASEAAVRQRLLDESPVLETLVRIPGGDAVQRTFGIRSPHSHGGGDEWVVAEVENATPVPFALALVIRPFVADGIGDVHRITLEKVRGGKGRDGAQLVRVDGVPAAILPRLPARFAAGNAATGDVVELVTSGEAGADLVEATCAEGLATLAMVFPLPHTAVLRVMLPVGDDLPAEGPAIEYPTTIPDAAKVASGWDVHRRGPRIEVPDRRLSEAFTRTRAQVQLAHDGTVVRRDGATSSELEAGATEVILGAFDLLDHPDDVATVVARWPERLGVPAPEVDALVLDVVARHWLLHRSQALLEWVLPEVSAAVERLDKADRRGRFTDPVGRWRAARALDATAWLLAASGQPDAAPMVARLATRLADGAQAPVGPDESVANRLVALADRTPRSSGATDDDANARHDRLTGLVGALSATGATAGPGPGGRPIGHDLAASAAVVHAVRSMVVVESPEGLALLPTFPDVWYGGGVEVHDAPTAHGPLSFAIRWHDARPALLWDLEPHEGTGPVRITIPGLDPTWSTTETRGDALLAEVPLPPDLERLKVVAEHPDIELTMLPFAAEPERPDPDEGLGGGLPEGGTFS